MPEEPKQESKELSAEPEAGAKPEAKLKQDSKELSAKPEAGARPEAKPEQKPSSFKHIVRVANVDLSGEKQIRWAMTKIKGIGINFADAVCAVAGIDRTAKTGNLSDQQVEKLNKVVSEPKSGIPTWFFNRKKDYESGEDKHLLTGTLSFVQENDIKLQKKIKSYRGMRHAKGLPVRGQRTRSNFRRSKGKVVGVSKKKITAAQAAAQKEKGEKKKEK